MLHTPYPIALFRAEASLFDGEVDELLLFEETFPEVMTLAFDDDEIHQSPLPCPFVSELQFL